MAYDRYDTQDGSRDERSRARQGREPNAPGPRERGWGGDREGRSEGGFFERAGEHIASWFGDDRDNERRDPHDHRREERDLRAQRPDQHRDREGNWNENRGTFASGGSSESDYNRGWQRELRGGRAEDRHRERERDYRPMTGDYGRPDRERGETFAGGEPGGDRRSFGQQGRGRENEWDRDPYRSTSRAGTSDRSDRSRHDDPHYHSLRERHMSELDRDYDEYRREHQSKFESEFSGWRERRQQKRGMLGQMREHMEVVGNDEQPVGTVERIAGDRIILAKSDPGADGSQYSISCADIDRVEGERVILDCSADQARTRWRDENRSRALFERHDQGEMGPHMLDRSFEGTYR